MRRTLRAIGRPKTSAGAIQLQMHAGLHSGRFHFFLVGESHLELLVTGPAATRTVDMEATSEAGEILLSEETAALLDDDVIGEERGAGRLLRAAPDVRGTVEPLPSIEGIGLEVAVPAPLRAQLLEVGPLEGEHRNAAIAFIRYRATDEVIATEGPEAAAAALDSLVRTVQAAAAAHGVTFLESDIDRDGGKIIVVSGAPQTFGDDEERMLRTVRAILDEGLPLPVHIGVSQGRVFAGQVGRELPEDVHRSRRHRGARRPADGTCRRGRGLGLLRGLRARRAALPSHRDRAVPREGEGGAGARRRARRAQL